MSRPFIPVPNCASVELIFSWNGEVCENTFHVQKGTPYSAADLVTLRNTVNTWDGASYAPLRVPAAILTRIRCKALDSGSAPMEDFTLPSPRAGTQTGTALPGNVTYCIKLATGLAGRSFRGRWYWIGCSSTFYGADANHVSSVVSGNLVAALNLLRTNLGTAGSTIGVVSYMHDHVYRTTGVFTTATGFVATDFNMDSMRRRLAGRGR